MSTRKNFDLEKFPENCVSKRMISRVSPIYERSYVAKWLYEVMGREVDDAEIRFSELREQANPETATWALRYWEQRYGIETNENRSLAARRADIIARRGARAPMNVARLEAMIRAMTGCETSVTDYIAPYTFGVRIIADGSEGIDIRKISEKLRKVKPSHLAYQIAISYNPFLPPCYVAAAPCGMAAFCTVRLPGNIEPRAVTARGYATGAMSAARMRTTVELPAAIHPKNITAQAYATGGLAHTHETVTIKIGGQTT